MQTKLKVGAPDDEYEKEADRMADQLLRMPEAGVQRQAGSAEGGEFAQSMSKSDTPGHLAPSAEAQAAGLRGRGMPLPASVRAFFERRFLRDFGSVRVHTNADSARAAHNLQARAFTAGTNIAFGTGRYAPWTSEGLHLLAHELTHVVQQNPRIPVKRMPGHPVPGVEGRPDGVLRRALIPPTDECGQAGYPPADVWYREPRLADIRQGQNQAYLRWGSSGRPVLLLQQTLTAWGCDEGFGNLLPRYGADGVFGSETSGAVYRFQAEQLLDTDRIVGPLTLGKLDTFVGTGPGGGKSPPPAKPRIDCRLPGGTMTVVTVVDDECKRPCRREAQLVLADLMAPCCTLANEAFEKAETAEQREAIRKRFRDWQKTENFDFFTCTAATANLLCLDREMQEKNCPDGDPECCPQLLEDRNDMPPIIQEHCPKAGPAPTLCPWSPLVS